MVSVIAYLESHDIEVYDIEKYKSDYNKTMQISEENLDYVNNVLNNFYNIQMIFDVLCERNISYEDAREQCLKEGKITK